MSSFLRLPPVLAGSLAALLPLAVHAQGPPQATQTPAARAAQFDPSEIYFQGYLATRDAQKLEEAGDFIGADEKLERARQLTDSIGTYYPEWKSEMVKGRQAQTQEAIARVKPKADAERLKKRKAVAELEGGEKAIGRIDPDPTHPNLNLTPPPPLQPNKPSPEDALRLSRAEAQVRDLTEKLKEANRPDAMNDIRAGIKYRDLEAQRNLLQSQLDRALADLQATKAQLAASPVQGQFKELNDKIDSLEQEREAMNRALAQSRRQLDDTLEKNKKLQAEQKILEADLKVSQQNTANYKRDLETERKVSNDTVNGLLAQKKALEATIKQKDALLAEAAHQIESLGRQIEESAEANKQLMAERDSLVAERDQMKALLKMSESERLQKLIEQNMGLAKDLNEKKARVEELGAENNKSLDDYAAALNDLAIAKVRINRQIDEKAGMEKQLSDLQQRLKDEDGQLAAGGGDPTEVQTLREIVQKLIGVQKLNAVKRDEILQAAKTSTDQTLAQAADLLEGQKIALSEDEQKIVENTHADMILRRPPGVDQGTARENQTRLGQELAGYDNAAKRAFAAGRLMSARELYSMSLEADPGDRAARNKLGFIEIQLQDIPSAINTFERAIEDDATNPYSYRMLGYSQLLMNDPAGAEPRLRRALELAPDDAASHLYLGSVFYSQNRIAEAESEFRTCIQIDQVSGAAYMNLAHICALNHKKDEAQRHYHEALDRGELPDFELEKRMELVKGS